MTSFTTTSLPKFSIPDRRVLGLLAVLTLLGGCTVAQVDGQPGAGDAHRVTATAACFGLCPPDREELFQAMHRQCSWPSVPAILVRGSESNGLLGQPHDLWKFTCLTVEPDTQVARIDALE